MGRIFISYKREPGPAQSRRDDIRTQLEKHYLGEHQFLVDEEQLIAGGPWRKQLFDKLEQCNCVLALYSEPSDWMFMELAYATFKQIPYIIVCFLPMTIPAPFREMEIIVHGYNSNWTETIDKIIKAIDSIIPPASDGTVVPSPALDTPLPLSLGALRAAFLEELAVDMPQTTSVSPVSRRNRFEQPFIMGVQKSQLEVHEMALVNELIDADFEKLPFESYPFDKYRLRYDLGTFLSELGGLNGHLLDLTPPIEIPNKRSSIRATKYLITRQVFAEFQQDTSREPISLSPAECYLPYLLNMSLSDDDLAAQVWNFADWVKRKLPLPKQTGVRLPTESEWLAMIMPLEQWTTPKLRRCNLHNGGNETPSMSAVGVFRDGQSSGAYDLIGNVWELCTPDGTTAPTKIAGRSYLDNISMLTSRNVSQITRPREDVVDFAVGFRLVIV